MIDDDDCDVREPAPVNDESIQPHGIVQPPQGSAAPNGLIAVIPVVRHYAQLKKTLKSRTIAPGTLATWEEHFKAIMASYPDPFPIFSQAYLDPRFLFAACTLQSARLFLYRHNLSPACRAEDRRDAIDRCVQAAKDTAHYVQRSMQQPSSSPSSASGYYSPVHMSNWAARLRTMAPAFFCNHLWRCALILCLRMEFASALTIVQASASIGDLRKNNIACGRNLSFFLERLIGRLRQGANQQNLDSDEEMLAYASGDLQGCGEESWVWNGSQTGANLTNLNKNGGDAANGFPTPAEAQSPSTLSERETHEWGGWDHIQRTLTQLLHDQQGSAPPNHAQQQQQPYSAQGPTYPPPPQTPNSHIAPQPPPPPPSSVQPGQHSVPAATMSTLTPPATAGASNGGNSSSRMSIKDIM